MAENKGEVELGVRLKAKADATQKFAQQLSDQIEKSMESVKTFGKDDSISKNISKQLEAAKKEIDDTAKHISELMKLPDTKGGVFDANKIGEELKQIEDQLAESVKNVDGLQQSFLKHVIDTEIPVKTVHEEFEKQMSTMTDMQGAIDGIREKYSGITEEVKEGKKHFLDWFKLKNSVRDVEIEPEKTEAQKLLDNARDVREAYEKQLKDIDITSLDAKAQALYQKLEKAVEASRKAESNLEKAISQHGGTPADDKRFLQEYKDAQTELDALNGKLRDLQSLLSETKAKAEDTSFGKHIQELKGYYSELEEKQTEVQTRLDEIRSKLEEKYSGITTELQNQIKEAEEIQQILYENAVDLNTKLERMKEMGASKELVSKTQADLAEANDAWREQMAIVSELKKHYDELREKMDEAVRGTKTGQELQEIESEMEALEKHIQEATSLLNDFAKTSTRPITGEIKETEAEIEELTERLGNMQGTVDELKSKPIFENTEVGAKTTAEVERAANAARACGQRFEEATASAKKINPVMNVVSSVFRTAGKEASIFTKALGKIGAASLGLASTLKNKTNKAVHDFGRKLNFKTILRYVIGVRSMYYLVRKLRTAIKEALTNIAKWNDGNNQLNKSLSELKSSLTFVKNAWGAAFAPIINYVTPLLSRLIDKFAELGNTIAEFWAKLTGQSTFIKAKKVMQNFAGETKNAKDKAEELEEKLGSYDKLEVIKQDKKSDSSNAEDDGLAGMFEEAAVTDRFDKIKKLLDEIWDVFKKAWENKGQRVMEAWERMLGNIKTLVTDIGKTWFEVWTNGTGQKFLESAFELLATIFDIIGSIAEAMDKAWNRDKNGFKWVTSIFEMFTSIFDLLSAIGKSIDKAFRSEVSVSIFSNILQIFTNINNTIKNIADNLKVAWGKAGVGDSIIMTIFEMVNDILTTINNITKATEEWAAKLNFSPILESVDRLFKSIRDVLQPILKFGEDLWNKVFLPLGKWTIEEGVPRFFDLLAGVFKIIAPILSGIGDGLIKIWQGFLQPMLSAAWDAVKPIVDDIVNALKGLGENKTVQTGLKMIGEVIGFLLSAAFMLIATGLKSVAEAVGFLWDKLKAFFDWIYSKYKEPIDKMREFGKNLIEGLSKGIDEFLSDPGAWVKEHIFDPIVTWFKNLFGINSPSKVFEEFGGNFIEGLEAGIEAAWGAFLSFFTGLFAKLSEAVNEAWVKIKKDASTAWSTAKGIGSIIINNAKSAKDKAVKTFTELSDKAKNLWNTGKETAKTLWNNTKTNIITAVENTKTKAVELWTTLNTSIREKSDNIKEKATTAFNTTKTNVITAVEMLRSTATTKFETLASTLTNKTNEMKEKAISNFNMMKTNVTTTVESLRLTVDKKVETIKTKMTTAWSNLRTSTDTKWNEIKTAVANNTKEMVTTLSNTDFNKVGTDLTNKLKTGLETGFRNVTSALSRLANSLTDPFRNIANSFETVGSNICTGIYNGISRGWNWLTTSVYNLATSLYNSACNALGIYSPSRKFAEIGKYIDLGLEKGLDDEEDKVLKKMEMMANLLTNPFEKIDLKIPSVVTGKVMPSSTAFTQAVSGASKTDTSKESTSNKDNEDHPPIILKLDSKVVAQAVWDNEQKRYKQTGNNRFAFGI